MYKLDNIPIGLKVGGALVMLLLMLLFVGSIAINRMAAMDDAADDIRNNWLPETRIAGLLRFDMMRFRQIEAAHALAATPDAKAKEAATLKSLGAEVQNLMKDLTRYLDEPWEKDLAEKYIDGWPRYLALDEKFVEFSNKNDQAAAQALYVGDMRSSFNGTVLGPMVELIDRASKAGQDSADRGTAIYVATRNLTIAVLILALLLGGAIALIVIRTVSSPIRRMARVMRLLAGRDLNVEIPGIGRADEIGAMAEAMRVFRESIAEADRMAAAERVQQEANALRAREIEALSRHFDESASAVLATLAAAATELNHTAGSMSNIADSASKQAGATATAAEEASTNVQTVAAATEELSASIQEIRRQVRQSTEIAGQAVAEAEQTSITVRSLSEAATKIGEVVQLINNIASQTNLLALNATIEAARAGDAGKGFAVVASEVKGLATQTARATEDIASQVTAMQKATRDAVDAIKRIDGTISQMNQISTAIATAVDQQGSATHEIARNVEQAAVGTAEVSRNISGVTQAADDTGAASVDVLSAAGALGKQAETLRREVDTYLAGIRAG